MNDLSVTSGQKADFVRRVSEAVRKATEKAIAELEVDNLLDKSNLQKVINAGDVFESIQDSIKRSAKHEMIWRLDCLADGRKLLSGGEKLVIGVTDGLETFEKATDLFSAFDNDFHYFWGTSPKEPQPTEETEVAVFQNIRENMFQNIFDAFREGQTVGFGKLAFTQAQVIRFIRDHRRWLNRGKGCRTAFLVYRFQKEQTLRVALLESDRAKFKVTSEEFYGHQPRIWPAGKYMRIVVPKREGLN